MVRLGKNPLAFFYNITPLHLKHSFSPLETDACVLASTCDGPNFSFLKLLRTVNAGNS
jgi:hypothetical protein